MGDRRLAGDEGQYGRLRAELEKRHPIAGEDHEQCVVGSVDGDSLDVKVPINPDVGVELGVGRAGGAENLGPRHANGEAPGGRQLKERDEEVVGVASGRLRGGFGCQQECEKEEERRDSFRAGAEDPLDRAGAPRDEECLRRWRRGEGATAKSRDLPMLGPRGTGSTVRRDGLRLCEFHFAL
jgi:hypothetical protein